jgi:predicted RND superfamily exporter protein
MAKSSLLERYSWQILLLSTLLAPLAGWGALKAINSNRNDVSDWLPANYPETEQLKWFRHYFVADQFILVSWDGCQLGEDPTGKDDDPRIARLVVAMKKAEIKSLDGKSMVPCFKSVTTAREVLDQLTAPPTELRHKQAVDRLQGGLVGPDGKQTVVMATLSDAASHHVRKAVGRQRRRLGMAIGKPTPLFVALNEAGLSEAEVRLGGPPIDNSAIDEEGEKTLVRLAGLSALLSMTLAYWSLRSFRMTSVVFACGLYSAALALALVPLTGGTMDAVLMSMPALVYVLAVSGAVHIINYYKQAAMEDGFEHAAGHAASHAWRPALLCSVTTAIGLASLLTSDITPIAKFGGYSALGVMSTLGVLFLALPASLQLWPWKAPDIMAAINGAASHGHVLGEAHNAMDDGNYARGWERFGGMVKRHHALVMGGMMALILALMAGLPKVHTSIDLLKLFSSDARLLQDYRWFEDHLGRIVPMELVIRFPKASQQEAAPAGLAAGQLVDRHTFLERLELVARVQQSIDRRLGPQGEDLVGATMSAATFSPSDGDDASGLVTSTIRYKMNLELNKHREGFEKAGYLRIEPDTGTELWRISVRVAAFHGMDHGELVQRIRNAVEPVLTAREVSVGALRSLAQLRKGRPNGSRVVVWRTTPSTAATDNVGAFLATKNVKAFGIEAKAGSLDDARLAELAKFDGVILGRGFDAGDFRQMRRAAVPILASFDAVDREAEAGHGPHDLSVVYTGVIPVVYKAQRALLDSLIQSTWWSFATIMPLMMWVCRGIAAGAVVMIPNTLPVLVVFGGMGWLGVPVDIGSMMAASIALGVAVDDTIHFLAWFRDDFKIYGDRAAAVMNAYRRSATPTLQAALINGLGLSVFATSSFTPTQRFGWLMLAILIAGVVAELLMTPALMFGPLGKAFVLKTPAKRPASDVVSVPSAAGGSAS